MAQTPEEFRNQERRKMRLQADLNARRNSLMNLITPDVFAEEGPGTALPIYEEFTPHPTVSGNVVEPRISAPLPGRDIVDANNAEALAFANQFPGQNLTDHLNRRAALRTGNDLANMRSAATEQAARIGDFENQQAQNAIDAEVAVPTIPTPLPAIQPAPLDYGPGLTPAAAEELYGPGGMYGTTPLPGGLYDQTGITRIGSRQVAFPSDERLQSSSTQLTDAVRKIKKRAAIIRGTAALVGGDQKAADRYEAKALADLGIYAGQYAMSQLTDADFRDKQTLFQSLLAKNMPLDQILQVLESGVADRAAKDKAQTDHESFYTTTGDFVGRYFKGTPEHRAAVNNPDLRTDKPKVSDDPTKGLMTLHKADGTSTTISMGLDPQGNRIWLDDNQRPVEVTPYDDIVNFGSVYGRGKGKDQVLLESIFDKRQKLKQMPDDDKRALLKSQLSELETLYIKNTALGGTSAANKFIEGRTAYYNGSAMIDRIFNVLGNAATKTGAIQTLYEVKGGFLDQMRQLPFWVDNDPIIKDVTERLGVTVKSNVTTLAYALAKAADPNGRVSDADFQSMLETIAPGGMMDRNTLAQGLVDADRKLRQYMESVYRSNPDLAQLISRDEIFDRSEVQIRKLTNGNEAIGFWAADPETGELMFNTYYEWDSENP